MKITGSRCRSPTVYTLHVLNSGRLKGNKFFKNLSNNKLSTMKKITSITVVALVFLTAASAQKARFGFNGGLTLSTYKTKADNEPNASQSKTGFTAGIFTDVPI